MKNEYLVAYTYDIACEARFFTVSENRKNDIVKQYKKDKTIHDFVSNKDIKVIKLTVAKIEDIYE